MEELFFGERATAGTARNLNVSSTFTPLGME